MKLHSDRVREEAARWYARLNSPECTQQERDQFAQWRQHDAAHGQAFAAAQRIDDGLARAATSNERLRAMTAHALEMRHGFAADARRTASGGSIAAQSGPAKDVRALLWGVASDAGTSYLRPRAIRRAWLLLPSALAASVVAAVFAVSLSGPSVRNGESAYSAPAGVQRQLVLIDGTTVHLDVGSEIEVRMSATSREVTLAQGRALFDVAHDAARPFSVSAGTGRVTALGTTFQVHRENATEVTVTLAEGAVQVSGRLRGRQQSERLSAGEQIRISEDVLEWAKQRVDTTVATSWSIGRHIFRDRPLGDAVAEVNRYATKKVVLADSTLAELSISGSFVSGDSDSVLAAFAAVLPIRVEDSGNELLLFRRR